MELRDGLPIIQQVFAASTYDLHCVDVTGIMTVIAVQAKQPWQDVVARKRAERTALLAPFAAGAGSDKGTNNDNAGASGKQSQGNESHDVTLIHSANELVDLIDRGDRSCVAVTKAYIQRFASISMTVYSVARELTSKSLLIELSKLMTRYANSPIMCKGIPTNEIQQTNW